MSDLDRYELFVKVAESNSLSQAAGELGMAKGALSLQIKKLEASVGADLFHRHKQRLILSEAGEILLNQCRRLHKALEDTRSISASLRATPTGRLHILAFTYFADRLIFPRLHEFMAKYPELALTISTHEKIFNIPEQVLDFQQGDIDIMVGYSLPAAHDIVRRQMLSTHYVMCASPDYLHKNGIPSTLNDLKAHRYIEHTNRPENARIRLKSPYELKLTPDLLLNSVQAMIDCAKQGLGFLQLPYYVLEEELKQGRLIDVLSDYQETGAGVYYFYEKFRYIQPKVRAFIDFFLKDYCESNRGSK